MLDAHTAAKKAIKEFPDSMITETLDLGNKFVFNMVPKKADLNKGWIDGYQSVDKKTGKVSGFSPMMDLEAFKKALKHPIDLAKE